MGRPVKRDRLGTLVFGTYVGAEEGIRCEAYIGGSNQSDVFIVKQLGARRYKVQEVSGGLTARCKLVTATPAATGEMRLTGYVNGDTGAPKILTKLMKKTAIASNGTKYKWTLMDDSTSGVRGYITLTAI
jgi:hypothetical protein